MARMGGFMCQSVAVDLTVCRSSSAVIVSRKKAHSSGCSQSGDSLSSTCSAGKYRRLVKSPSLNISEGNQRTSSRRCSVERPKSMASILPASESSKDDVFQVSTCTCICIELG